MTQTHSARKRRRRSAARRWGRPILMRGSFMRSVAGGEFWRSGDPSFECIVRDMESLSFIPGRAFLSSDSPIVPWTVVFEDEGVAAYFYACDRSREKHDESILDAMLIYNVGALAASDAELKRPVAERIAAVEWSRDGLQAVLYLDGAAQGLFDFDARCGYCRMDFP